MSRLSGFFSGRRGRSALRRVSPARARTAARVALRDPLNQPAEKILVAACVGLGAVLVLGLGHDLGVRSWIALSSLVALGLLLFVGYLADLRRSALASLPRDIALGLFLLLPLGVARLIEASAGVEGLAFLPLSFTALVVALAWNRSFALDCTVFSGGLLFLGVLLQPLEQQALALPGLLISVSGGITACLGAGAIRRRNALFKLGAIVGCVQLLTAAAMLLLVPRGTTAGLELSDLPLLGLEGLLAALLIVGLLPVIETLFQVTTDISLLELGNTQEQPLLRKLLVEAPGTFHHSYLVGLLSESAAEAVGANALLARVGSFYHDVGKLNKPGYFAENSPEARGRHKDLTPEMSTLIISSHPRDGVELGRYYGIPPVLLRFMTEHHGTSCVEYFFTLARKMRGPEEAREENFRYPGPKPQSIETAIVMLADAVEAIARQIPDPNQARLAEMVHEVAQKRLMDRQFDECPLTLRDLERIEEAFLRVLLGIYHTRPTYPKGPAHPLDLSQPSARRRGAEEREGARRPATTARSGDTPGDGPAGGRP